MWMMTLALDQQTMSPISVQSTLSLSSVNENKSHSAKRMGRSRQWLLKALGKHPFIAPCPRDTLTVDSMDPKGDTATLAACLVAHFTQAPALSLGWPAQLLLAQTAQVQLILQKDRPWLCSWHLHHCKIRLGNEPSSPSRCRESSGQNDCQDFWKSNILHSCWN